MRSNGLRRFREVQAAGCEHQPRVTGGDKGSCETPGLSWVNTLLGNSTGNGPKVRCCPKPIDFRDTIPAWEAKIRP